MCKLNTLVFALLLFTAIGSAQPITAQGSMPGDLLYGFERFSDTLELKVAQAPIIGSEELESKVRANHADERLEEARKLYDLNRTQEAEKIMAQYRENIDKAYDSAEKANKTDLSQRLDEVNRGHTQKLTQIRDKAPEKAKKGITTAIENSQKNSQRLKKRGPTKDIEDRKPKGPENNAGISEKGPERSLDNKERSEDLDRRPDPYSKRPNRSKSPDNKNTVNPTNRSENTSSEAVENSSTEKTLNTSETLKENTEDDLDVENGSEKQKSEETLNEGLS